MRAMTMLVLALAAAIAGCDGSPDQRREQELASAGAAAPGSCDLLNADDVQSITGTTVTIVDADAALGLGGNCANFVDAQGQPYLGVNHLSTRGLYATVVEAVPVDLYPIREPLSGLGDEAVLMSGGEGRFRLQYLVARKGGQGVVLFPLLDGMMPDDQLRALAERALSRLK